MAGGLLDGISNPEFLAEVERQRQLIQRVADHFGCPFDVASDYLDAADAAAMATFSIGNTVPRETLN